LLPDRVVLSGRRSYRLRDFPWHTWVIAQAMRSPTSQQPNPTTFEDLEPVEVLALVRRHRSCGSGAARRNRGVEGHVRIDASIPERLPQGRGGEVVASRQERWVIARVVRELAGLAHAKRAPQAAVQVGRVVGLGEELRALGSGRSHDLGAAAVADGTAAAVGWKGRRRSAGSRSRPPAPMNPPQLASDLEKCPSAGRRPPRRAARTRRRRARRARPRHGPRLPSAGRRIAAELRHGGRRTRPPSSRRRRRRPARRRPGARSNIRSSLSMRWWRKGRRRRGELAPRQDRCVIARVRSQCRSARSPTGNRGSPGNRS
jgi:hypothetical protein